MEARTLERRTAYECPDCGTLYWDQDGAAECCAEHIPEVDDAIVCPDCRQPSRPMATGCEDVDCGCDFAEWLGLASPESEDDRRHREWLETQPKLFDGVE